MEPKKAEPNRQLDGTFGPGNNANPNGRPKGKSLKEFWKQRFAEMTEEERLEFTKKVAPEIIWKMAEGNPENKTDVTSAGKPIPILNVPTNDSHQEDNSVKQED